MRNKPSKLAAKISGKINSLPRGDNMFFSNLFKRCPKTGKIRGINKSAWPAWSLLFAGLAACAWYLFRVIPKPSRAEYPCQRAAAPIRIGFLTYCVALAGYAFSFTKAKSLLRNKKTCPGRSLFCGGDRLAVCFYCE